MARESKPASTRELTYASPRTSQRAKVVVLHRATGEDEARHEGVSYEARASRGAAASRAATSSRVASSRAGASSSSRVASSSTSTSTSARRPRSKQEEKRRQRAKAKADKMFERQFGGAVDSMSTAANMRIGAGVSTGVSAGTHTGTHTSATTGATTGASSEGAPRAALYKGQMGASQKRAARMQRSSRSNASALASLPSISPGAAVRNGAAQAASRAAERAALTTGTVKALTAVLCTVLVCAFLYTPLQQYYQAQREYAKLSAEYESIESRNDALDVQNDILVSEAGKEDTVRQRFGYVKSGESTGVVLGLSENATDGLRGSENIEANVLSSTVKAPEEWYTPFLDALFGVE